MPVLSDDVTPLYARECRRCVDDLEEPPQSQLQIPTRRISTPVAGGDYVFGTVTGTALPSSTPTRTATPTVTGTMPPTSTPGALITTVFTLDHSWFQITRGAVSGSQLNGVAYHNGSRWRNGVTFSIVFPYPVSVRSVALSGYASVTNSASMTGRLGAGSDFLMSAGPWYNQGGGSIVRNWSGTDTADRLNLDFASNDSLPNTEAAANAATVYFTTLSVSYVGTQFTTPTPTPSPTSTLVTYTPTPSPTLYWGIRTPRPNGGDEVIDCRVPLWRDKTPVFQLPELKVIGSACYRVVPLIDLDLSSYSIPLVDTSWVPPVQVNPVDLCVTWQLIGDFAFMGMSVPFDILFALPLLAFLWRLLYRF